MDFSDPIEDLCNYGCKLPFSNRITNTNKRIYFISSVPICSYIFPILNESSCFLESLINFFHNFTDNFVANCSEQMKTFIFFKILIILIYFDSYPVNDYS